MFSNPKVTFSHQSPPFSAYLSLPLLPSLHISPFTLTLVSVFIFLPLLSSLCFDSLYSPLLWFFSPPFTLCKPKVICDKADDIIKIPRWNITLTSFKELLMSWLQWVLTLMMRYMDHGFLKVYQTYRRCLECHCLTQPLMV